MNVLMIVAVRVVVLMHQTPVVKIAQFSRAKCQRCDELHSSSNLKAFVAEVAMAKRMTRKNSPKDRDCAGDMQIGVGCSVESAQEEGQQPVSPQVLVVHHAANNRQDGIFGVTLRRLGHVPSPPHPVEQYAANPPEPCQSATTP